VSKGWAEGGERGLKSGQRVGKGWAKGRAVPSQVVSLLGSLLSHEILVRQVETQHDNDDAQELFGRWHCFVLPQQGGDVEFHDHTCSQK
jgi:hypothetical protein